MANPRNVIKKEETVAGGTERTPASEWKSLTLGSISLRGANGELINDYNTNFVINERNAQLILDAAQFVVDNPGENITLKASPFFEGTQSAKVLKHFTHRFYVMSDTLEKIGKTPADYVKEINK